jgi:hypothetical protein
MQDHNSVVLLVVSLNRFLPLPSSNPDAELGLLRASAVSWVPRLPR